MENDTLKLWYTKPGHTVQFISNEGQNLMVGFSCDRLCGTVSYFLIQYIRMTTVYIVWGPSYAIEDERGGYGICHSPVRACSKSFCPLDYLNTPYSASVSEMEVKDGALYSTEHRKVIITYNRDGFFIYNGTWETYNEYNTPETKAIVIEFFTHFRSA
jgi:hypothetical protein